MINTSDRAVPRVGFVVIGRNEGRRLVKALESLGSCLSDVVYVDSNSSDGSLERARDMGSKVVALDMTKPFSAARARNAGFSALVTQDKLVDFVQFMDGDCELDASWISTATSFLTENEKVAIVCGRRREKFPERSTYNRLCDLEWDTPVGQAQECGGDFLIRVSAFCAVSGFSEQMIAGEEPELCARLRAAGWKIWRLDAEMTWHDADITKFRQWWRRSIRCGYSYAALWQLHGSGPDRLRKRQIISAVFWGGVFPIALIVGTLVWLPTIALFAIYPLQAARVGMRNSLKGRKGIVFGSSIMLAKFSELVGIVKFWRDRRRKRGGLLIEYK
jgi:GT2 family glycosyltransferase